MEFQKKIVDDMNQKWPFLSQEERSVLWIIWNNWKDGKKITQNGIADSDKWLGCHPKHEQDIVRDKRESTLRQVRQIIRNLRVIHKIPILSDNQGYWLPQTKDDVIEYVENLERTARAQAAAWFETYKCVKETIDYQSSFFENYAEIQN